jgi:hypothetical protein
MKALLRFGLLAAMLAGGCEVTTNVRPPGLDQAIVTRTEPTRAWRVIADGELHGLVVMYAQAGAEGDEAVHYYSVRNGWHQELGTIDAQGRAFRHVPHEREARWVGTGTLLEGARAVLDAGPGAELVELPLADLRTGDSETG